MGPPLQLRNLSHKGASGQSLRGQAAAKPSGSAATFDVSFANAKPPTRTYSAEACLVQFRNNEIFLIFAQRTLMDDGFDTAISIRMHSFFALQFLRSVEHMSPPTLSEIAAACDIPDEPLDTLKNEPGSIAKLSGNVCQVSIAGYEVCLDFYQLSPLSVARSKSGKRSEDIELLPVARVDIRTSMFIALIKDLKRLSPSFATGGKITEGTS